MRITLTPENSGNSSSSTPGYTLNRLTNAATDWNFLASEYIDQRISRDLLTETIKNVELPTLADRELTTIISREQVPQWTKIEK